MPDEYKMRAALEIVTREDPLTLTAESREYVAKMRETLKSEGAKRALEEMADPSKSLNQRELLGMMGTKLFSVNIETGLDPVTTPLLGDQLTRKIEVNTLLTQYGVVVEGGVAAPILGTGAITEVRDKLKAHVTASATLRAVVDPAGVMSDVDWITKAGSITNKALLSPQIRTKIRQNLHTEMSSSGNLPDYTTLKTAYAEKNQADAKVTAITGEITTIDAQITAKQAEISSYNAIYDASGVLDATSGSKARENEGVDIKLAGLRSALTLVNNELRQAKDPASRVELNLIDITTSPPTVREQAIGSREELLNFIMSTDIQRQEIEAKIRSLEAHKTRTSLDTGGDKATLETEMTALKTKKTAKEAELLTAKNDVLEKETALKTQKSLAEGKEKSVLKRLDEIAFESLIGSLVETAGRLDPVVTEIDSKNQTAEEARLAKEKEEEEKIKNKILAVIRKNQYMRENKSFDKGKIRRSVSSLFDKDIGLGASLYATDARNAVMGGTLGANTLDRSPLSAIEQNAFDRIMTDTVKMAEFDRTITKDLLAISALKDGDWLKKQLKPDELLLRAGAGDMVADLLQGAVKDKAMSAELARKFPDLVGADKSKMKEFMKNNKEGIFLLLLIALGLPLAAAFL